MTDHDGLVAALAIVTDAVERAEKARLVLRKLIDNWPLPLGVETSQECWSQVQQARFHLEGWSND
jgi:hypothetical protein